MSVFSPNGTLLAQPCCRLDFDNQNPGCLEQQDKLEKVKNLAVAIALAVAGVDKHITNEEFNVISQWVRQNLSGQGTAEPAKIDKALRKAVHFFQAGKQLDTPGMCREILELASTGQRYDLMELFLKVAAADQCATARELQLLKKLSHNLQLDTERFRHMVETMLPLHMHQVEDAELVLGINGTMTPEQSRRQLNLEYRKWNARVTNADPAVKSQADQMLNLIAQARSQFA